MHELAICLVNKFSICSNSVEAGSDFTITCIVEVYGVLRVCFEIVLAFIS